MLILSLMLGLLVVTDVVACQNLSTQKGHYVTIQTGTATLGDKNKAETHKKAKENALIKALDCAGSYVFHETCVRNTMLVRSRLISAHAAFVRIEDLLRDDEKYNKLEERATFKGRFDIVLKELEGVIDQIPCDNLCGFEPQPWPDVANPGSERASIQKKMRHLVEEIVSKASSQSECLRIAVLPWKVAGRTAGYQAEEVEADFRSLLNYKIDVVSEKPSAVLDGTLRVTSDGQLNKYRLNTTLRLLESGKLIHSNIDWFQLRQGN